MGADADNGRESTVSAETQLALDLLRQAAAAALERKRLLGQYAVVWKDGAPAIIGGESDPHRPAVEAGGPAVVQVPGTPRRRPHPEIAGKGRTLGDLVSPILEQDD